MSESSRSNSTQPLSSLVGRRHEPREAASGVVDSERNRPDDGQEQMPPGPRDSRRGRRRSARAPPRASSRMVDGTTEYTRSMLGLAEARFRRAVGSPLDAAQPGGGRDTCRCSCCASSRMRHVPLPYEERVRGALLFADVSGFTKLTQALQASSLGSRAAPRCSTTSYELLQRADRGRTAATSSPSPATR